MKFLILGASGMAGHQIACYLRERGHVVRGFSRRRITFVDALQGDASKPEDIKRAIHSDRYDIIVNAIGLLNNDAETQKSNAAYLNAYLPHSLVDLTADMPTKIIHMSTDCVFAGNTGPYTEDSFPDGRTFYDRTKALGEISDRKNLTLRNSIVGPDINELGIGLLNWFMKQEGGEIWGYSNALWSGLTTLELARVIEAAASSDAVGLVNMVNNTSISKYDLLVLFNEYLRPKRKLVIVPQEEPVLDKTLLRKNFEFDYMVPDYEKMVSEMMAWISSHPELYPAYYYK